MQVDARLKAILESLANNIIPLLAGSKPVEVLKTELISVIRRVPDVVVRLEDGTILHVEIQSTNDPRMPLRMLQYWLMLAEKYGPDCVSQAVLYVGNPRMTMPDGFDYRSHHYRYQLRDIREFEPDHLLASALPAERALALLCRRSKAGPMLERILGGWATLTTEEQASLFDTLVIVSGLRKLEPAVEKATKKMPLTDEFIRENTILQKWMKQGLDEGLEKGRQEGWQEGRQEGRQQGEATVLRRLIQKRFGALPDWASQRIDQATPDMLERWEIQFVDAKTVEEVFA